MLSEAEAEERNFKIINISCEVHRQGEGRTSEKKKRIR